MGIIASIKEYYYELEDGYYDLLDRIEKGGFPIYKIVDPIDGVVPSYPLLAVLSLVLLAGITFVALGFLFQGANASLVVRVTDQEESVLPGVLVNLSYSDGRTESVTTDDFGEAKMAVPKGAKVTLTVGGKGYKSVTRGVEVAQAEQIETVTLEAAAGEAGTGSVRTLRFLNEVGQPVTDELHVEFRCKNPYATPPEAITVSGGKATVNEPAGCGQLIATITDSGTWDTLASLTIDADVKTIYLEASTVEAGRILVNVTSKGQPVSGVDVDLYRYEELMANAEIGPVDSTIAFDGQATFNKPQGSYVVKVYDGQARYGQQTSDRITVRAGESATVAFDLTGNVRGQVSLKIVDKSTRQPLANARVTLRLAADDSEFKSLTTGTDGMAIFNVTEDVEYRVGVEADGFVLEKIASARMSASVAEIQLEKCTAQKCGLLTIQVMDEDGVPVGSATVALYMPETNFIAGYENKVSDANGFAKFGGVKPGLYYGFAFREFGAGRSNDFRFAGGAAAAGVGGVDATVTMQVGKGNLLVNAVDKDSKPVPFPLVNVYSTLSGTKIGSSFGDANGVFSIDTKADKEIYVRVEKDGYATYISPSRKIQNGGLTRFIAVLEPQLIDRPVEVKFLGLFKGERVATTLAAGEEYTGRWQLRVPAQLAYTEAGIHIRTGDELIMEKDDLYLKGVNAPGAAILKATAYDEKSGFDESSYDYTYGDAKWLHAIWKNPKPGIYEVEAVIQVRKTASVGDELNVHYRSWAAGGVVVRDPADDFIETRELYNNAYKQTYQIGASTLCDQDFCFDMAIRDMQQDLTENVIDTYQAQVFTEYEATFTLTNNSKAEYHTSANLRIANPDLSLVFLDYTLNDADGRPRVGKVNGPEFPRLDIGNLAPNKRITGKFRFATQRAINGVINFRLVSDQQIAFDRYVNIAVAASKELNILLERTLLSSGVENDLVANLVDTGTNLEVGDATCRLKDKRGNVIVKAKTDSKGRVVIRVPAQLPGVHLVLECEKEKFDRKETEITVTSAILEVQPTEISVSLNSKSKPEAEQGFHAKSLANFPLKVTSIELVGSFKNLLDEQQTRNWLVGNYKDYVIQPGQTLDATLRVFLSDDGKALIDRVDLTGKLLITVTNFGQEWVFEVPARIGIGLSGDVDTPGCLTLTRNKWETTTEGNPVNVEFQIQNNCTINGQPVPMRKLEALVIPQGNQLGEYKLTVGSTEVELRSAYSRAIVGEIKAGETLNAILTFTPYGGTLGEANADLSIAARNPKEDKDQLLEAKMNTRINIVNIKDCVSFDKHLISMPEQGNATFTISTKKCGGKTGFELTSDLELSVKEFVLDGDGTQQVQVFAGEEVPGQYGVVVKSKAQNEKQEQLIRNVRVRVDSIGCLSLSRYEFDVLDRQPDSVYPFDGFDNAQLTNRCVDKEVSVKVDHKDLTAALKEGLKWGVITLGAGILKTAILEPGLKKLGIGPQCTNDAECDAGKTCQNQKCVDKPKASNAVDLDDPQKSCPNGTNTRIPSSGNGPGGQYYPRGCVGTDGCFYNAASGKLVKLLDDWQPNDGCKGAGQGITVGGAGNQGVDPKIMALFQAKKAEIEAKQPTTMKILDTGTQLPGITTPLPAPAIAYTIGAQTFLAYYNNTKGAYDEMDITSQPQLVLGVNTAPAGTGTLPPSKVDQLIGSSFGQDATIARFDNVPDAIKNPMGIDNRTALLVRTKSDSILYKSTFINKLFGISPLKYLLVDENGNPITEVTESAAQSIVNRLPPASIVYNPFTGPVVAPAASGIAPAANADTLLTEAEAQLKIAEDATKAAADRALAFTIVRQKLDQVKAITPLTIPQQQKQTGLESRYTAVAPQLSGGTSPTTAPTATPSCCVLTLGTGTTKTVAACISVSTKDCKTTLTEAMAKKPGKVDGATFESKACSAVAECTSKPDAIASLSAPLPGLLPITGLPIAGNNQSSQDSSSTASNLLSPASALFGGTGGMGGIVSSLFGAATGSYGIVGQAMAVFLTTAATTYFGQGEESVRTLQDNVEVKGTELYAGFTTRGGTPDTDVKVKPELTDKGKPVVSSSRDPRNNSRTEKRSLQFTNLTQFVTEPESPKVKYLLVKATQHNYDEDKVYKAADFDRESLDELKATPMDQKFRLQFNAVPPEADIDYKPDLLNCQAGVRTGRTGAAALPKVEFNWNWNDTTGIKIDSCDADNPNGIFCDATQFSIALLKKVDRLVNAVNTNKPFTCPSAAEPFSNRTATIGAKDIGISRLQVSRTGNDQNVTIELTNNNPGEVEAQVKAFAVEIVSGKTYKCSPDVQNVKVNQALTLNCKFSGLPNGTYRARADILPNLACPGCQNNPASDNLEVGFAVGGAAGLEQCTPYSTGRLEEFLAASGKTGGTHADALKLVNFRANLIKDRYSSDFQKDFDEFARTENFFDTTAAYRNNTNRLPEYFRNSERFIFKPRFGTQNPEGYQLPSPGVYDVTVNIVYDNSNWTLYDGNKLTARIEVLLDRLDSPEPDSPFYYLPFDGFIGNRNGRVGYGLNYKGDKVRVNSEPEALYTVEIPGSTPMQGGMLEAFDKTSDFKRLNNDRRGTLLEVSRGATNQLTFSPSFATPLILEIINNADEAWAFYSLAVGNAAANVGPTSAKWNGIGYSCSSFDDRRMIEAFYETPDQHGLETACALLGGEIAATSYGFEFCKPLRNGLIALKTVYYTPQDTTSTIKLNVSNDQANFVIRENTSNETMRVTSEAQLNGVQGMPFNSLAGRIGSLEDIFTMVKDEQVCVSGTDTRADFWWNPKKVTDNLKKRETDTQATCIKAS